MYKVYLMEDRTNKYGFPYIGMTSNSLKVRAHAHKGREKFDKTPHLLLIKEFQNKDEALKYEDELRIKYKWGSESQKAAKKVFQINKKTNEIINEFSSLSEAALATNSIVAGISYCCSGQRKTHNGYKWKLIN
jgi:predicted GIY-YIG superfamily endonuclease